MDSTTNCTASAEAEQLLQRAVDGAVPAVLRGVNAAWPALRKWAGLPGLQYLQQQAGHAEVQAMLSHSSEFFGDIEHHTEVSCSLGQLLAQAQEQLPDDSQPGVPACAQATHQPQPPPPPAAAAAGGASQALGSTSRTGLHLYLAQQPLTGAELSQLLQDVPPPSVLRGRALTSTNLWFSSSSSRSSLHYDPYDNLLCVVTGSKRVKLYSPAAVVGLYPQPLGGEASNHSCVDFARPDLELQHPLFRHVQRQVLEVVLSPGDALFIPEGWWHQVDSEGMTLAVNFWWDSQLSLLLKAQPHQHAYFLRQLLEATSSEAVQLLLGSVRPFQQQQQQQQQQRVPPDGGGDAASRDAAAGGGKRRSGSAILAASTGTAAAAGEPAASKRHKPGAASPQDGEAGLMTATGLTSFEEAALQELVSTGSGTQQEQEEQQQQLQQQQQQQRGPEATPPHVQQQPPSSILATEEWWAQQRACQQSLLADAVSAAAAAGDTSSSTTHDLGLSDPVSRVLAALQPGELLRVLWAAAERDPGAVGGLLLHGLSPAAAQLLTQGLEAADCLFGGDGDGAEVGLTREAFYRRLYGTVRAEPQEVLRALLQRKTRLAAAATRVLLAAQLHA